MKYFYYIVLVLMFLPYFNYGQVTDKGMPVFNKNQKTEIPLIILPEIDIKKLKREDKKHSNSKLKSLRFAEIIEVDICVDEDAYLDNSLEKEKIYYLSIKSSGAYSISVLFDRFRIPRGAKLYIYSADHKHIRGSFTYKNNKWNKIIAIAPIKGDEIILEYHEPSNAEFKGELNISSIAHDYKNIFNYLSQDKKGFGDSGDCNINVNCDDNEMWQQLKHSVCKITYNGWLCSGVLINNTNQDEKPYLLTANHCINSSVDASAAVFYFNYESTSCDNIDGRIDQTISGSTIIASPPDKTVDFSLLELSVNPPPSYKPYFSGWNRDILKPTSVTSIHHPSGDVKKITKSYDGAETGDYGEGYNEFSHWWIDEWDEGTTEGGSSGSPLFNQNGEVIGDLTGGDASCSFNFNDYYQKFYHAWNSFPDPNFNLKPWLDPANSNEVSINGFLPYDSIPTNLKASLNDTVVKLTWNDVIDTVNIQFYYVYRNLIKIDSVKYAYYEDTVAFKNVLYEYFVTAKYISPITYESKASNKASVRTMDPLFLPFLETFEGQDSLPYDWFEERFVDTIGWQFKSGGYEGKLDTAFEGTVNAYFYSKNLEFSRLVLPRFDLSAYANVKLSFYMHMQESNDSVHNLKVLYKKSDSLNWNCIRSFNSSIDVWEKKEISLLELSDNYQIAFEGTGAGGYGICIDSVLIVEDKNFVEPHFITNKDTICLGDSIQFTSETDISNSFYWDFGITATPNTAVGSGPHWVKYSTPGIKPAQLIINDTYVKTGIDAVIVSELPDIPDFTNIGNELISNSNIGNQWYLNDTPIVGATSYSHTIDVDGDYSVEVTNRYNCSSHSANKYMIVSGVEPIFEEEFTEEFAIYPNPNKGIFTIQINEKKFEKSLTYKLFDITGKLQQSGIIEPYVSHKNISLVNSNEGIYIIQVYSQKDYFTSKILIKK